MWFKIVSTNQNAEFFGPQYLETYLSHEVKVLHVGKHHERKQIYVAFSSENDSVYQDMFKNDFNQSDCNIFKLKHFTNELSYELDFLYVDGLYRSNYPQK